MPSGLLSEESSCPHPPSDIRTRSCHVTEAEKERAGGSWADSQILWPLMRCLCLEPIGQNRSEWIPHLQGTWQRTWIPGEQSVSLPYHLISPAWQPQGRPSDCARSACCAKAAWEKAKAWPLPADTATSAPEVGGLRDRSRAPAAGAEVWDRRGP